jgi:hypothetical protein
MPHTWEAHIRACVFGAYGTLCEAPARWWVADMKIMTEASSRWRRGLARPRHSSNYQHEHGPIDRGDDRHLNLQEVH